MPLPTICPPGQVPNKPQWIKPGTKKPSKCIADCKPLHFRNEETGKCVSETGAIGTKILFEGTKLKLSKEQEERAEEELAAKLRLQQEERKTREEESKRRAEALAARLKFDEEQRKRAEEAEAARLKFEEEQRKRREEESKKFDALASVGRREAVIFGLNASLFQRNDDIDELKERLSSREESLNVLNEANEAIQQESEERMEKINELDEKISTQLTQINKLNDEVAGKDVTIQDLRNQGRQLRSYNITLSEKSKKLEEDLRQTRSDKVNLIIQNNLDKNKIIELRSEIETQIQEKQQLITQSAIRENLNNQQQAELRDRINTIVQEREAIEHALLQTSINLNAEIDRLEEIVRQQSDQISQLMLEKVRHEEQIVALDRQVNQHRRQQRFLLQRQQVNNETLANAQNELRDSNVRNAQITIQLQQLSVETVRENAQLQSEINSLSLENRGHIETRDQLGREIHQSNNQIRRLHIEKERLRLEREQSENDSLNTQEDMQSRIVELTRVRGVIINERDVLLESVTDLVNSVNDITSRLNYSTEENIVMSAQLRAAENTIIDFRRRLFEPTE